ncbi:MAG: acetylornithine deacetylase, partial [Flavobacteriales bacterium CG_4_10_14_0_2_um_filter_35_18]
MIKQLKIQAIDLLKTLIATPSFSGEEQATAQLIKKWFTKNQIEFESVNNNVWAKNKYFEASKKTILLNSHHD